MGFQCTRRLEFDAGHRVKDHEGKCATLHGHRYRVDVTAEAEVLDGLGRVVDFSVLKARIGTWLDTHWDHNTILFQEDLEVVSALCSIPRKKEPWIASWNPTAENMALHLINVICPEVLKGTGVKVVRVVVHETPNCSATVEIG